MGTVWLVTASRFQVAARKKKDVVVFDKATKYWLPMDFMRPQKLVV